MLSLPPINEETKRLAMQAAEECLHQSSEHKGWLEQQIAQVFSHHDASEGEYICNDEMEDRMNTLKQRAMQGSL